MSNRRAQAADDTGEQRRQSQRPPGRRTTGPPGDVVPRQLAFIYEPETYVPTEEELRRNVQGALPPGVIDVGRDAPPRALPHAAAAARAKPTALPSGEPILVDILDVDLEEFDYGRVPRELLAGRRERRRLSGDALRDALADHVVAQLHRLPRRPQQQARRLMVFKGGGYVYADMFYMLARAGLDHAIGMTNVVAEADCVVAKASWEHNPGRRVNLDQHRAAAANQRIPFVLVNQVRSLSESTLPERFELMVTNIDRHHHVKALSLKTRMLQQ